MHTIEVTRTFACPAEQVWQLTGNFGGLTAWLPGVLSCQVSGEGAADNGGNAVRTVQLVDGSITRERLDSLDTKARRYVYSVVEAKGMTDDSRFQAHFQVLPQGDAQCEVRWGAAFTLPAALPPEKVSRACQRIEQMYLFFLQYLQSVVA